MAAEIELCPRCTTLQRMRVSETVREEASDRGSTIRFRVISYHCANCSVFVKSVETPIPTGDAG